MTDNAALCEIAEIVHDIDLKDDKFHRLEAVGLDSTIRGLALFFKDDRKLLNQCPVIFDGLYEQFNQPSKKIEDSGEMKGERK